MKTDNVTESSVNKIQPGDLIRLRKHNAVTGDNVGVQMFIPLPRNAFSSDLPLSFFKPEKPHVVYTSADVPILFLRTVKMPPGSMYTAQKRSVYMHQVLIEETVYYITSWSIRHFNNDFYTAQRVTK